MSDYGDDYSDYGGEDWLYVEEEYMVADDLAEHAVQSPPPTTYDEDTLPEWDRFDYFNDLEYASDGYDNAKFVSKKSDQGAPKTGQKRKRGATVRRSRKKHKPVKGHTEVLMDATWLSSNAPVVWRSQMHRGVKPRLIAENAEPYALLKDWREKLANIPQWTQASPQSALPELPASYDTTGKEAVASELMLPDPEGDAWEDDDNDGGEDEAGIDPAALMTALQSRLASAGGPLSGMDPQQLLQFAMRMANDQDAGDDIAGEMANEMLNRGDDDEEEEEETEANLLSWVAQQRDANEKTVDSGEPSAVVPVPDSPVVTFGSKRLPTPPSSEANRNIRVNDETMVDVASTKRNDSAFELNNDLDKGGSSRKRKADDASDIGNSTSTTKKRATRSFDAPTASSQAKSVSSRTTRSGRTKR